MLLSIPRFGRYRGVESTNCIYDFLVQGWCKYGLVQIGVAPLTARQSCAAGNTLSAQASSTTVQDTPSALRNPSQGQQITIGCERFAGLPTQRRSLDDPLPPSTVLDERQPLVPISSLRPRRRGKTIARPGAPALYLKRSVCRMQHYATPKRNLDPFFSLASR